MGDCLDFYWDAARNTWVCNSHYQWFLLAAQIFIGLGLWANAIMWFLDFCRRPRKARSATLKLTAN